MTALKKPKLAPQQQAEARQRRAEGVALRRELADICNVGATTTARLAL
jgi:hypothetical protein